MIESEKLTAMRVNAAVGPLAANQRSASVLGPGRSLQDKRCENMRVIA